MQYGIEKYIQHVSNTVAMVQKRIALHPDYFSSAPRAKGRTRIGLIDPILFALGWDVTDPDSVRLDFRATDGWVDYALLGASGRPIALVEAKSRGAPTDNIRQFISTAIREQQADKANFRFCVWTDGARWWLFEVDGRGETSKEVTNADIETDSSMHAASRLIALQRMVTEWGDILLSAELGIGAETSPVLKTPSMDWVPLEMVNDPTGRDGPSIISFPEERVESSGEWKQFLLQTVRYLAGHGGLSDKAIEWTPAARRHRIVRDRNARDWETFGSPVYLKEANVIVETKLNSLETLAFTKFLLFMHDIDPEDVYLRFGRVRPELRQQLRVGERPRRRD